jgi:hypothetical protein
VNPNFFLHGPGAIFAFATDSTLRESHNWTLVHEQKQQVPDCSRKACRSRTYPKLNWWIVTVASLVERLSARERENVMRTGVGYPSCSEVRFSLLPPKEPIEAGQEESWQLDLVSAPPVGRFR